MNHELARVLRGEMSYAERMKRRAIKQDRKRIERYKRALTQAEWMPQ